MHHPTDRITHTTAFGTPVVEDWLEREIPNSERGNPLPPHGLLFPIILCASSHRQDNTYHGLCTPVVEHWLEREIAQWRQVNVLQRSISEWRWSFNLCFFSHFNVAVLIYVFVAGVCNYFSSSYYYYYFFFFLIFFFFYCSTKYTAYMNQIIYIHTISIQRIKNIT